MVELEHARSILSEPGLATASELLDAKIEDAMHKELSTLAFVARDENVIFPGPPGVGFKLTAAIKAII